MKMEREEKEVKKEEENEKQEEEVQVLLFQHRRWTLLRYLHLLTGRAAGKGEGGRSETER